jgi:hypothetical protein
MQDFQPICGTFNQTIDYRQKHLGFLRVSESWTDLHSRLSLFPAADENYVDEEGNVVENACVSREVRGGGGGGGGVGKSCG